MSTGVLNIGLTVHTSGFENLVKRYKNEKEHYVYITNTLSTINIDECSENEFDILYCVARLYQARTTLHIQANNINKLIRNILNME